MSETANTSTAVSSANTDAKTVPDFKIPENFHRSPGNDGYWFCIACKPCPHTPGGHIFNASSALAHERTKQHTDFVTGNLPGTWITPKIDQWGYDWGANTPPFELLQSDQERTKVPVRTRVKGWMKEIARAEGLADDREEDDDDEQGREPWPVPENSSDDWRSKKPWKEVIFYKRPRDWDPERERERERERRYKDTDPRLVADFKFVEKVARMRGLSEESYTLHRFFRLPTEEKINRIREIAQLIPTLPDPDKTE